MHESAGWDGSAREVVRSRSTVAKAFLVRKPVLDCIATDDIIEDWSAIAWNHVQFMIHELHPLRVPHLLVDAIERADTNVSTVPHPLAP